MKKLNKIIASVMSIALVSASMVMPMTASAVENPEDYALLYKIYENNKNQKRGELNWGWWYACWDVTNSKQYRDDCEQYTLKRVEDEEYSLNIDFTNTKHIRFNSNLIGRVKQSSFDISGAIEAGGYISFKMYDVSTAENTNDLWMSMSHANGWKYLASSSPMAQYIKGQPTNQWVTVEIPMSVFKESFFEGLNTSAVVLTGFGSSTNNHNLYIQDFNVYSKKFVASESDGVISWVDNTGTASPTYEVWRTASNSDTATKVATITDGSKSYTIPQDTNGVFKYTVKALSGETVLASANINDVIVRNAEHILYKTLYDNIKGGQAAVNGWPGRYTLVSTTPNSANREKTISGRGSYPYSNDGVAQATSTAKLIEPGSARSQVFDFDIKTTDKYTDLPVVNPISSSLLRFKMYDGTSSTASDLYDITDAYNNNGYISFLVYDKSEAATMDDLWVSISSQNKWSMINTDGGIPQMGECLTGLKTNRWHMVTIPLKDYLKVSGTKYADFDLTKLNYFAFGTDDKWKTEQRDHELYVQSIRIYCEAPRSYTPDTVSAGSVTVTATSKSIDGANANLIVALYGSNNTLKAVNNAPASGGSYSATVTGAVAGDTVKAFIWDMTNALPLEAVKSWTVAAAE